MGRALFFSDVPRIEGVHCIVFFVALHVMYSRQVVILLHLVEEADLVLLLFLFLLAGGRRLLLRWVKFYYWGPVSI